MLVTIQTIRTLVKKLLRGAMISVACVLAGCHSILQPVELPPAPWPVRIRFLLTFDDGPSIRTGDNPTLSILKQLELNDIQPGIKAIFFVQTRNTNGGGTEVGKAIMRRTYSAGHVLGLHSASPRGHVSHARMSSSDLNQSLQNGIADIRYLTGRNPILVRPPFLAFNPEIQDLYAANYMNMLLSDVSANDGVIHIFSASFRRRNHIHSELRKVRAAIERNELQRVGCCIPVVVTFHDVNTFTANHLSEYLHILMEAAVWTGLLPEDKPFYDTAVDIERAAVGRSILRPRKTQNAPATVTMRRSKPDLDQDVPTRVAQ